MAFLKTIFLILTGYMFTFGLPFKANSAVVPAESIRVAVVEEITVFAESKGEKVNVTVPFSSDIDIGNVLNPVIKVFIRGKKVIKKKVPVSVEIYDEKNILVRKLSLGAVIKKEMEAFVASGNLVPGSVIRPEDMAKSKVDVPFETKVFTSVTQLSEKRVKRPIKKGELFSDKNVGMVPLIKRGDKVKIMSKVGSVSVESVGIARSEGGRDQTIRVFNEMTKKNLVCSVVDSATVVIGEKE